jgi:hypothetical protein
VIVTLAQHRPRWSVHVRAVGPGHGPARAMQQGGLHVTTARRHPEAPEMKPLFSRALLVAGLVALLATSTGCCSSIGMGLGTAVGAGVPRYSTIEANDPRLSTDENVQVRATGGASVEGRYVGVRDGALIVSNDSGEHAIAPETIRELRVKNGTYWERGMVTGLVIGGLGDVALAVFWLSSFGTYSR